MLNATRPFGLLTAGYFVFLCLTPHAPAVVPTDDHLTPIPTSLETGSPLGDYKKLWQTKLLVTPGEVARFVDLPLSRGESAVSLHRTSGKKNGLPGGYWVTSTFASGLLWECIPQRSQTRPIDPRAITISRSDAPLPEPVALVIHKVWLAMLKATQDPPAGEMMGEGNILIFSASDPAGIVLRARVPNFQKNNLALLRLGIDLFSYGNMPARLRPAMARKLKKNAEMLLERLSRHRG